MTDAWAVVTCARCDRVYQCTPDDDYYATPLFEAGRVCEACMLDLMAQARARQRAEL